MKAALADHTHAPTGFSVAAFFHKMTSRTIFVLNGPNLNLLGTREPNIYGYDTLADIEANVRSLATTLDFAIEFRQTNHEGVLVDWLHEAWTKDAMAVLLNAGAYTHTSIAILDAIKAIGVPVIEVHLSDPSTRETFRHHSFVRLGAVDAVKGLGAESYLVALKKAAELVRTQGK